MGSSVQKDRPTEAAHLLWDMAPRPFKRTKYLSFLPFLSLPSGGIFQSLPLGLGLSENREVSEAV